MTPTRAPLVASGAGRAPLVASEGGRALAHPPGDCKRPDLGEVLHALSDRGQLIDLVFQPGRPAVTAPLARSLPAEVTDCLPAGGLWSHQARAVDLARDGCSVVVATGTGSGKSLCYQLPVAAAAAEERDATALVLHPTKALARDQLRSWAGLDRSIRLAVVAYDGDTGAEDRSWARRQAQVVLTNPDMLHVGILPNHERWGRFLAGLRYVVIDELHTLRGIFGGHVAHVLRRLRRLAQVYGSSPVFIFTSATIGNPAALASALCGLPVTEVTLDGAPRRDRLVALWNPPLGDGGRGQRGSANLEAGLLLAGLVGSGYRAMAFTRSRRAAELVAAQARDRLPSHLAATVCSYRGGYLPHQRRAIEADLFEGRLRGVAATSALELGIDVGGLDACILDGFPGTIASFWQQAGRAGRPREPGPGSGPALTEPGPGSGGSAQGAEPGPALTVLVAGPDALDQWWMAHPDELLRRPPEPAVIAPANPFVLHPQLVCAAHERPLEPADEEWWGAPHLSEEAFDDAVRALVERDRLVLREGRAVHADRSRPAGSIDLRGTSSGQYQIVAGDGTLIGTVAEERAFATVHPGAVYLHQGQHYRVEHLDLDDLVAWVTEIDPDELTQARTRTEVAILGEDHARRLGPARLSLGAVEVTEQVVGYRRRDLATGVSRGDVALDLPVTRLITRAFWWTLDLEAVMEATGTVGAGAPGSLHAAEHAAIAMLPLFAICDRWDVGGLSTPWLPATGGPTIVVYDGYPGGCGVAELGHRSGADHLRATLEWLRRCPCQRGCPSCVQSPKCGNLNEPLDKAGAIALLSSVLCTPLPRFRGSGVHRTPDLKW